MVILKEGRREKIKRERGDIEFIKKVGKEGQRVGSELKFYFSIFPLLLSGFYYC